MPDRDRLAFALASAGRRVLDLGALKEQPAAEDILREAVEAFEAAQRAEAQAMFNEWIEESR